MKAGESLALLALLGEIPSIRLAAAGLSEFSAGMACPDGSWKPGRYDFLTRTRHVPSGVVAVATLSWTKSKAC